MRLSLIAICLMVGVNCSAAESNPLLGRWSWSTEACQKSAFIFDEDSFSYLGDADGQGLPEEKYQVKYKSQSEIIFMELDRVCSLCMGKKELSFQVIDEKHVYLIRYKNKNKKIQKKLVRCY